MNGAKFCKQGVAFIAAIENTKFYQSLQQANIGLLSNVDLVLLVCRLIKPFTVVDCLAK